MPRSDLNPVEGFLFWTLALTWPFYFIGALYIVAPAIAWSIFALLLLSLYLGPAIREDLRVRPTIPLVVWSWILGMSGMLVALWVGHIGWSLGSGEIIKSTIGWMKGWGMAALFPLIGATFPIRRGPIVRGQSVIALWTLLLIPIMIPAAYVGLPSKLFVSPLSIVGGPGPEYFSVYLYTLDPETWTPRWQFYAPWAPFAGLIGVVSILFALEESDRRWLVIGVLGGLALIFLSKSRMSLVGLAVCAIAPRLAPLLPRSGTWKVMAGLAASLAIFGQTVLDLITNSIRAFKEARVSSSRVRDALQRIAYDRWSREAPWFGHGAVERGPHLVEYMPIGSHHTWFGLLYVKGVAGVGSLLLPMAHQFVFAFADAMRGSRGRLPLGLMLSFVIQSFGENVEIEVYLFWPSFLLLGIHAREVDEERISNAAMRRKASAEGTDRLAASAPGHIDPGAGRPDPAPA